MNQELKSLEVKKMKVVIDVPKDFEGDYIVDKFKDFFSRVIADIDCKGMCGRYEKEIAEMFLKAFDDSEEKTSCNCQNNNNSKDNEPCCRCDSRKTNADRIRNMSDGELAEFLITFKNTFGEEYEGEASCMEWLRSEAE
jgi:hypothetical protein